MFGNYTENCGVMIPARWIEYDWVRRVAYGQSGVMVDHVFIEGEDGLYPARDSEVVESLGIGGGFEVQAL